MERRKWIAWSRPSPTPVSSSSNVARKAASTESASRTSSRVRSSAASAAVRGLATSWAMTLGWRASSSRASGWARTSDAACSPGRAGGRWGGPWRRSSARAALRRWARPPTAPRCAPRVPRSPGAAPRGGAARQPREPWVSPLLSQYEKPGRSDRAFLRHLRAEMRQKRYFGGTMNESAPGLSTLPHTVFLRRLAGATRGNSLDAKLGRAAFVALRLVDLLGPDEHVPSPDAFHYQHAATERACRGIPADRPETGHLIGVVQSADDAFRAHDVGLLFPALFAYAHYLEDGMRLEEALDVLETTERVGGEAFRAEDGPAARLRLARVLRKLNRFDEAERAYEEGGALAAGTADRHSQLVSRMGCAYVVTARGNLGEAERLLCAVLHEAEAEGDSEAQALAHQGIAVVQSTGGRAAEALPA